MKLGFTIIAQGDGGPIELLIYDDVFSSGCEYYGGVCADDIITALGPNKDREILVRINSPGGDVGAGLALYNKLREFKNLTTIIDGWAASAASIIALAGRTVRMARNAFIMIHNPSGVTIGDSRQHRKMADDLDKARGQLIDIYARETGNSAATIATWMDDEKMFDGPEAFEAGFVDEVIDQPAQTAHLGKFPKRFRHVPPQHAAAGASRDSNNNENTQHMATASTTDISACGCGGKLPAATSKPDELTALRTERDELKAQVQNLQGQLDLIKTNDAAALKARAITAVDAAINDKRLDPVLREPMIAAYIANETETLPKLAALKPQPTAGVPGGAEPLKIRSDAGIKSMRDQINDERDPKKRQALRSTNWEQLRAA